MDPCLPFLHKTPHASPPGAVAATLILAKSHLAKPHHQTRPLRANLGRANLGRANLGRANLGRANLGCLALASSRPLRRCAGSATQRNARLCVARKVAPCSRTPIAEKSARSANPANTRAMPQAAPVILPWLAPANAPVRRANAAAPAPIDQGCSIAPPVTGKLSA
jgi:hypothetical protein